MKWTVICTGFTNWSSSPVQLVLLLVIKGGLLSQGRWIWSYLPSLSIEWSNSRSNIRWPSTLPSHNLMLLILWIDLDIIYYGDINFPAAASHHHEWYLWRPTRAHHSQRQGSDNWEVTSMIQIISHLGISKHKFTGRFILRVGGLTDGGCGCCKLGPRYTDQLRADSGLSFYWMLDGIGLINCNWR